MGKRIASPDYRTEERVHRIRDVLSRRQRDLTLVLANIHDPHNVSAVLRSCDAFGVDAVHLYYTRCVFPVLGHKSSASAKKWVARSRHDDAEAMFAELKAGGGRVYGTGFSDEAMPLTEVDFTKPTAVILGNEHDGMDPELASRVDGLIYIPMMGMVQSLNVSVAAAVTLYEAWRQRFAAGMYENPGYEGEELEAKVREWSSK